MRSALKIQCENNSVTESRNPPGTCNPYFDNIVPRKDLSLQNGNQKRRREAANETATRSGKMQAEG
jgi:hypothetical protein